MIYEVEGDILLTRAQLVVHNVTTFDPMNRGIARKLKDKYPAMAEAFHLWCGEAGAEPGDIWRWEASDHTQMIALITQEGDEDPTRIRRPDKIALHRCLRRLAKEVTATRVKSLAMPRIASGTFGLDWSEGSWHAPVAAWRSGHPDLCLCAGAGRAGCLRARHVRPHSLRP